MKDYVVVDVDNKVQPEDKDTIENYENNIKKLFVPENTDNVYIEMTGNYGLHIILKNDLDLSGVVKNRWTDIYEGNGYAIDLFVPVDNGKRSLLVMAMPHEDNIIAANGQKLFNRDRYTKVFRKNGKDKNFMRIVSKCDKFTESNMTFT